MSGKNLYSYRYRISRLWHDKKAFEFRRGNNYAATEVSEIILAGAANTFNHAMDAKAFKAARNLPGGKIKQMLSQVFVSQSVDEIFSADDDFAEVLVIGGKAVDAFVGSSVEFFGRRNLMKDFLSCGGIINRRPLSGIISLCI